MKKIIVATLLALPFVAGTAQAEGDAKKGEKVFKKCKACHDVKKPKNKVGPYLTDIMGRKMASVEGYKYSKPALKHAEETGGTWTEEELFKYLADPSAYLGGRSKMTFKLKKEDQRHDVIAYLKEMTEKNKE